MLDEELAPRVLSPQRARPPGRPGTCRPCRPVEGSQPAGVLPRVGARYSPSWLWTPVGNGARRRRRSATGPAGLVAGDLAAVGVQDLAGGIRRSSAAGDRRVARVPGERGGL